MAKTHGTRDWVWVESHFEVVGSQNLDDWRVLFYIASCISSGSFLWCSKRRFQNGEVMRGLDRCMGLFGDRMGVVIEPLPFEGYIPTLVCRFIHGTPWTTANQLGSLGLGPVDQPLGPTLCELALFFPKDRKVAMTNAAGLLQSALPQTKWLVKSMVSAAGLTQKRKLEWFFSNMERNKKKVLFHPFDCYLLGHLRQGIISWKISVFKESFPIPNGPCILLLR